MKTLITLLFSTSLYITTVNAQNKALERAQELSCGCIDSLKAIPFKQRLDSCIGKSSTKAFLETKNIPSTVEGVHSFVLDLKKALYNSCLTFRQDANKEQAKVYEALSSNQEANKLYQSGNELTATNNWEAAIPYYEKAINLDPQFLFAVDNLALCYRHKNDYKTASKYYKRSLEIFPAGSMAIQNLAVVYSFEKKYDEALQQYNQLKYFYPNDPEGYFGAGKIQAIESKYEQALDDLFIAHQIYTRDNSGYIKDSNTLVAYIYTKMKETNQLDAFMKKAQQHHININLNNN